MCTWVEIVLLAQVTVHIFSIDYQNGKYFITLVLVLGLDISLCQLSITSPTLTDAH